MLTKYDMYARIREQEWPPHESRRAASRLSAKSQESKREFDVDTNIDANHSYVDALHRRTISYVWEMTFRIHANFEIHH